MSTELMTPEAIGAELYVLDSDDQARVLNEFGRLHAETKPKRFADHIKWICNSPALDEDGRRVLVEIALELLPSLQGDDE